jgi:hypothetical protein
MRTGAFCGTAILAATCLSCGNSDNLYPVSGKVTCHGEPAAGAAIFLDRVGGPSLDDHLIMGIVQEDGTFTLVSGPQAQGVPAGEYAVLIEWKQKDRSARGSTAGSRDRLGGRYADPSHPVFHVTIKPEPNRLPPFELSD